MNAPHFNASSASPYRESIHYWRLDFEFTGRFDQEQPELEPAFLEGEALVVAPIPGCVIRGTLVDCPETEGESGWVIVDTSLDTVAVESPALRQLMVENAPCHLELVAVPLEDHGGRLRWDWNAYEISPNGARILVSEPHCELRTQPATQWASEVRDLILPALQAEIILLKSSTSATSRCRSRAHRQSTTTPNAATAYATVHPGRYPSSVSAR